MPCAGRADAPPPVSERSATRSGRGICPEPTGDDGPAARAALATLSDLLREVKAAGAVVLARHLGQALSGAEGIVRRGVFQPIVTLPLPQSTDARRGPGLRRVIPSHRRSVGLTWTLASLSSATASPSHSTMGVSSRRLALGLPLGMSLPFRKALGNELLSVLLVGNLNPPRCYQIDVRKVHALFKVVAVGLVASTELVEFWKSRAVGGAPHRAEPTSLLGGHRAPR